MKGKKTLTFWWWMMRLFLNIGSIHLGTGIWLVGKIKNRTAVVYKVGYVVIRHTVADVVEYFANGRDI